MKGKKYCKDCASLYKREKTGYFRCRQLDCPVYFYGQACDGFIPNKEREERNERNN